MSFPLLAIISSPLTTITIDASVKKSQINNETVNEEKMHGCMSAGDSHFFAEADDALCF